MLTFTQRHVGRGKPDKVLAGATSRQPWAWDGLCFAAPILSANRDGLRDAVTGLPPTTVTAALYAEDQTGSPAVFLGESVDGCVTWPDDPTHDRPSAAITVYVRLRYSGNAETSGGIANQRYVNDNDTATWGISASNTPGDEDLLYVEMKVSGVDYSTQFGTDPIPTDRYVNLFFRWASGGLMTMDHLIDGGTTIAQTSSGPMSGTLTYNPGSAVRLGGGANPALNFDATYSQLLVWSRRLSDTEMTAIGDDPFGWMSPRRESLGLSFSLIGIPSPAWSGGQVQVG